MSELNTLSLKQLTELKGYYRFVSGSLTTDSSGNSHTLTAIGTPVAYNLVYGNGFDGSSGNNGYSLPNVADFKPTGAYSVGCWFKTSINNNGPVLFQNFNESVDQKESGWGLILGSGGGAQIFNAFNTGGVIGTDIIFASDATNLADGNLHFVVGTYDGTNLRIYVDGTLKNTSATSNPPVFASTSYVRVGCDHTDFSGVDDFFLQGQIGDLFFINGLAISAAQVTGLYNASTQLLTLVPTASTMIASDAATTNYAGTGVIQVGNNASLSHTRRSLLQFNLGVFTSSTTVQSAILTVTDDGSNFSTNSRVMSIYRLIRAWVEGQVTWNKATSSVNWGTAGAANTSTDRESANIGTVTLPATAVAGVIDIPLTESKVQDWFDGGLTNDGVLLQVATESGDMHEFYDRTTVNPPQLLIDYIGSTTFATGGMLLGNLI